MGKKQTFSPSFVFVDNGLFSGRFESGKSVEKGLPLPL